MAKVEVQSVVQVATRFADVWARLAHLADAADLPTRAREHLAKAQRLTVQWLATLAFFWAASRAGATPWTWRPTWSRRS